MSDSIPPAVYLSNLSLSFGSVHVLKNLNLRIEQGRHVALIGRSGAGKTSLLAIIGGLLKPTSGSAETLGNNIGNMNEDSLAALRRNKIGVVFQHFHLLETMTALENAALPLDLAGHRDSQKRAKELLDIIGLADRIKHFPSQLSGGERQRVAIARAFASSPPLLLADEPTGNLDDDTSDKVLETLFALGRERGTTMLFVTHNTALLPRFDDVWQMRDGGVYSATA